MTVLPSCMTVYPMFPVSMEAGRKYKIQDSPGTVVSCHSCKCWESNQGPLQEQSALMSMGLSLQLLQ